MPFRPYQPRTHDRGGYGRRDRTDLEHELELLTLDAARSPQADDHRRRSEREPGHDEQPAGKVDCVHRPVRARETERVRYRGERLRVRPGA